jgi:hypothetical protein
VARLLVVVVVASACRYRFDEVTLDATGDVSADVLLGHDEDGDGITDSADFCPHIADTMNDDSDGDGVGDVCDIEPTMARQTWELFAPMTGSLPLAVGPAGGWTMNVDDWHYSDGSSEAQLIRDGGIGGVDAWVGFDVEAVGTGGVQAAIITNGMSVPYWYGEVFDDGTNGARISIAEFDGNTYSARTQRTLGGPFPLGANDLYLSATIGGSYTLRLGSTFMTTYSTPSYAGQRYLMFSFGNHSGRVRYVAIVTSQ